MNIHFDVKRIIGITIRDRYQTGYKWLPRKQKTKFFGLIKTNKWHEEGFYSNGEYFSYGGYGEFCFDQKPYSREDLIGMGYLVEGDAVYNKPMVNVYLEHKQQVNRAFGTYAQAFSWVTDLKSRNGGEFEIVQL